MSENIKIQTVTDSKDSGDQGHTRDQFALDVLIGFSAHPKGLASKYFYDDRGSELFAKITDTDDYYPTKCEFEILTEHAGQIAQDMSLGPFNLIELGAGDGRKTKVLLREFLKQGLDLKYIPIDISGAAIDDLIQSLSKEMPDLPTEGVVAEYLKGIQWVNEAHPDRKNLVLFLGSNIGNFGRPQAIGFLRSLWMGLNHGDLILIGYDLKKDLSILNRAYNDRDGVTRDFNLNVLERINRELDGEFQLDQFQHFGSYDPQRGAMESYLISNCEQDVYVGALEKTFHFDAYEPVHMEYSYKYLKKDIERLAGETGFEIVQHYYDSKKYFCDSLWRVKKTLHTSK